MFFIPSGTETPEQTELLSAKMLVYNDSAALLSAAPLQHIYMGHLYFELDFGSTIVVSDTYNVIYDPSALTEP